MKKTAKNISSGISTLLWRGPMSKIVPKLQRKFAARAPAVLKAFSVKVPKALDPETRVVVSHYANAPLGEVDTETGVIFINIAQYTQGRNFKGKPNLVRQAVQEMDHTLWHEYVHYLQITTKLVSTATIFDEWLYKFKALFQDRKRIYYTNSVEQQAFIEEIRYMQDHGKSEKDIRIEILSNLLRRLQAELQLPAKDVKMLATSLIKKNRKKFIKIMMYHIGSIYPTAVSSMYGRYLNIKGLNRLYDEAQITMDAYNSFFKMMDYQSKNPKLRWFRTLT